MSIFAINCDATYRLRWQHVCAMSWAIDPASHCALYRISLSIVICDIFSEASFEERYFGATSVEIRVAYRYNPVSHGHTVFHRDIVQCLVPRKCWQRMSCSKLVCQVQGSNTPLFRLATTCTFCIIPLSCLLVYNPLGVLEGHGARACSPWSCLALIVNGKMLCVCLDLRIIFSPHELHIALLLIELWLVYLSVDSLSCRVS